MGDTEKMNMIIDYEKNTRKNGVRLRHFDQFM